MAATRNGRPPTNVIVMYVVPADKPYMTLRPKLSGRLLSTPALSCECYVCARRDAGTHPRSPCQIGSAAGRARRCRGSGCWRREHPRGGLVAGEAKYSVRVLVRTSVEHTRSMDAAAIWEKVSTMEGTRVKCHIQSTNHRRVERTRPGRLQSRHRILHKCKPTSERDLERSRQHLRRTRRAGVDSR